MHHNYEVIAIDQRGAGLSRPSLNCHERDDQTLSSNIIWIRDCYRRLVDDGIALHAYNSANNANDIHDLLVALEIEEANVYGISYGSRLALTIARDFPQRVRALILDGVLPLQVNSLEALAVNGNQAFDRVFIGCAADADCKRAYPDLRESLYELIRTLNRAPAEIESADEDYPIVTTGQDFAYDIYYKLYEKHSIPYLPALIDAYAQGEYDYDPAKDDQEREGQARYELHDPQANEYDLVAMEMLQITDIRKLFDHYRRLSGDEWDGLMAEIEYRLKYQPFQDYLLLDSLSEAEQYLPTLDAEELALIEAEVLGKLDDSSEGTQLSFQCAEEVHFNRRDEIANRAADLPGALRRALVDWALISINDCKRWDVPRSSSIENQPVKSDIPTLLLSGQYDPITPPPWGEEAAKYLAKSLHYVFPDGGHGLLFTGECADSIALSFLADPERQPEAGCMADLSLPDFYVRR